MPDILIKKVPADVLRRLKEDAAKHRRSMEHHVLALIENSLEKSTKLDLPAPIKTAKPLTQTILSKGIKEGRP